MIDWPGVQPCHLRLAVNHTSMGCMQHAAAYPACEILEYADQTWLLREPSQVHDLMVSPTIDALLDGQQVQLLPINCTCCPARAILLSEGSCEGWILEVSGVPWWVS